ncbi:acetoacetate--CoA ligase [Salsipaludibacter albus]|uniref:acetoacetate--CoA ligase n=1 Tax=Salsipaludibacter albus TaxID=2849650 RepID=UPI001EE4AAC2
MWSPPTDPTTTRMGRFLQEYAPRRVADGGYEAAWEWSTSDPGAFWAAVWDEFNVASDTRPGPALADASMPGAVWFPEARINYARHLLATRGRAADDATIIARSQTRPDSALTLRQLNTAVGAVRAGLQRLGVGRGDRVAAWLPNIPETLVAFLATASLGAIWSSVAPEFGTRSVIDRLSQVEPKVLLAVDGYRWGDRGIDRRDEVAAVLDALDSVEHLVALGYLDPDAELRHAIPWDELAGQPGDMDFVEVPFDHPLYVLFSSGTTGLPKPIVHGHGGILLEHCKTFGLHLDMGRRDRFFWYSTTGWMMWNFLVSAGLVGAATIMFDGNPGHPDLDTLWELVADSRTTYAGVSAPFVMACRKAGIHPGTDHDLSRLRGIGSTGAPLPPAGFDWLAAEVSSRAQIGSLSGGTDLCTAFVGPAPLVEVRRGEIPCRMLGASVAAYDDDHRPVVGTEGELVITEPMPSMPVAFWGDDDGSRLREAYFDDIPGVWRHGDWITITERGSCIISGRSDATLNRGGVRLGTAEFYAVVDPIDRVDDALVVHLPGQDPDDSMGELVLFLAPADGASVDDDLVAEVRATLRDQLSPRHVPDRVVAVEAIPRTLSGKRLEVPVKRILAGTPVDEAASRGALANPASLQAFADWAEAERRG